MLDDSLEPEEPRVLILFDGDSILLERGVIDG